MSSGVLVDLRGAATPAAYEGRRIEIYGTVQGVGLRPWVYRLAREGGVVGRVRNDAAGVTIEAFGTPALLDGFIARLRNEPPPAAAVRVLRWQAIAPDRPADFRIVASEPGGQPLVSIPPDLATCPECMIEVTTTGDRRYRYAFTNCTNCGPRYTIARDVPYDRAATTMAAFPMCAACRREYESVNDRRFHAQPNACPVCGPQVRVLSAAGVEQSCDDPIAAAADALCAGRIVAVKGLGGFHLACDATSALAVGRLRARKRRDHKPFAVMVSDLAAAERLALLNPAERGLLTSVERPIVLVTRRPDSGLAATVAADTPQAGVLIAYSPLHRLLLDAVRRPLVMTSGNLSEEPIAQGNAEAVARLGGVADLFLVHDREIAARCDDSVARVIAGAPVVLRRARGYVPRPLPVTQPFRRPVLACGAHLKNTFCFGIGAAAYLGPHIGDLDNIETLATFEESIARMERFLRVRPEVIAYDLHPGYLSTRYALSRPELEKIGVQHHHAHVASAMAEHGVDGPVLGVAYDGTGYGPDGTAWGGEFLLVESGAYERLATFRPLPLPGSERAIREVWRVALAALDDAFAGAPPLDEIALFRTIPAQRLKALRRMVAGGVQTPLAHGVGRYFDALGAIVLGTQTAHYEGQVAMQWNGIADPEERGTYPIVLEVDVQPWQVDLRPLLRAAVDDLLAERPPAAIAGKFHHSLARATAEVVRALAARRGRLPVVLTGGCFQNALLAERVLEALTPDFTVYLHRQVPPGDGGIALGQAVVAGALAGA